MDEWSEVWKDCVRVEKPSDLPAATLGVLEFQAKSNSFHQMAVRFEKGVSFSSTSLVKRHTTCGPT